MRNTASSHRYEAARSYVHKRVDGSCERRRVKSTRSCSWLRNRSRSLALAATARFPACEAVRPVRPPAYHAQRGGLLIKLLVVLVLVCVLAAAAWVVLLPGIVSSVVRSKTGFAVKVEKLSVNPFTATVRIKGLVVENPADWPEAGFVDLRQLTADAELFSLFSERFVADEVVVDVAQVTIVRNKQGVLNAMAFKERFASRPPSPVEPPPPSRSEPQKKFLIRHLVMKFDKLVYADYSGTRPSTKTYALNIDREMKDVDSVSKLISPFSGQALAIVSNTLGGVLRLNPDQLMDAARGIEDAGKRLGDRLKNLFRSLENKKP
jgi:hypothetical protein